jgi:hypothetical protein
MQIQVNLVFLLEGTKSKQTVMGEFIEKNRRYEEGKQMTNLHV